MRIFRASIWVMAIVLWPCGFQLAGAMEKKLFLGPSPEDVDATGLPRGWQVLQFHDSSSQTQYTVEIEGDRYAIKAVSESSASGIYTEMEVELEPEAFQEISWEWKIENLLTKGDMTQQSGDDSSVRIIVAFHYQSDRASLFRVLRRSV